jgi:hypothetical protein
LIAILCGWTLKLALKLEMHNVGVVFEVLEDGKSAPHGWTKASGHIIWDLKIDVMRKARWVLEGHCWGNVQSLLRWYVTIL